MEKRSYEIRFLTPAFLGDAEQNGRWRTPPFKALLRQWWRVVYAQDHGFDVNAADMRREEGVLFGHAWLKDDYFQRNGRRQKVDARKSAMRIRLEMPEAGSGNPWSPGSQRGVEPLPTNLDSSYAWFGLVDSRTKKALRTGIATKGQEALRTLKVAVPEAELERLEKVFRLIARLGQIGARSRGGWGSVIIDDIDPMTEVELQAYARTLNECLDHDWPMSLGCDNKGVLLWKSKLIYSSWDTAIKTIATERSMVRKSLKSLRGKDLRPLLGFATKTGRMPSPLRWRVTEREDSQVGIEVFAMPSLIPEQAGQRIGNDEAHTAWQAVIKSLDQSAAFVPREQSTEAEG